MKRKLIVFLPVILLLWVESRAEVNPLFEPLIHRLLQEGLPQDYVVSILSDPRTEVIPDLMTLSLTSIETPDQYARFLTKESILSAQKFLRENEKPLCETEKRFNVEREFIVAILLVESRFGENTGRHRVIPTLATLALLDSPKVVREVYEKLLTKEPDLSFAWVEAMAKRRAEWAFRELKFFLQIVRNEDIDPLEVRGSRAGALGIAQFLPSSYLAYSLNNGSFKDWLSNKEAAFVSVANYLRSHGWKMNMSRERRKHILWAYNPSQPYAETVLQLADRIWLQRRDCR